jgi:hypothetical protein
VYVPILRTIQIVRFDEEGTLTPKMYPLPPIGLLNLPFLAYQTNGIVLNIRIKLGFSCSFTVVSSLYALKRLH